MNKEVIIVYKEPGKEPEFKKVANNIESFKELVGGDIACSKYDSYVIVFNKDQDLLLPNVYLSIDESGMNKAIKGNIFAINFDDENEEYLTLNKEQAFKSRNIFIRESFDYSKRDEYGNFIKKKKNKKNKNKNNQNNNNYSNLPYLMQALIANNMQNNNPYIDQVTRSYEGELSKNDSDDSYTYKTNENQNLDISLTESEKLHVKTFKDLDLLFGTNKNVQNNNQNFDKDKTLKLIYSIESLIINWMRENS